MTPEEKGTATLCGGEISSLKVAASQTCCKVNDISVQAYRLPAAYSSAHMVTAAVLDGLLNMA